MKENLQVVWIHDNSPLYTIAVYGLLNHFSFNTSRISSIICQAVLAMDVVG